MSDDFLQHDILDELNSDEAELLEDILSDLGDSRRKFIGQTTTAALGTLVLQFLAKRNAFAGSEGVFPAPIADENAVNVAFRVNGVRKSLSLDSRVTLLDALRERLGLTGSKKGCDHGQCGACTVMIDGRRVLSCLTLTAQCEGKEITTVEGIAKGDELHAIQTAFIKHDGFQCGFCTPGQICSAIALMHEAKTGDLSFVSSDFRRPPRSLTLSDDEIRERMSGNLCRCGAYPNIVAAIREVHTGKQSDPMAVVLRAQKEGSDATV